jgi:hypothetical protein
MTHITIEKAKLEQVLEALKQSKTTTSSKIVYGLCDKAIAAIEQALAAQPAVPDAFGTREGEHPQYIQGWNDCRAEMLKGMK